MNIPTKLYYDTFLQRYDFDICINQKDLLGEPEEGRRLGEFEFDSVM